MRLLINVFYVICSVFLLVFIMSDFTVAGAPQECIVALKSHKSFYVGTESGEGFVDAKARFAQQDETFVLIDLNGGELCHGDQVAFRTHTNHFLGAVGGGGGDVNANPINRDVDETFVILRSDQRATTIGHNDSIFLKTRSNRYIGAIGGGGGNVDARPQRADVDETFHLLWLNQINPTELFPQLMNGSPWNGLTARVEGCEGALRASGNYASGHLLARVDAFFSGYLAQLPANVLPRKPQRIRSSQEGDHLLLEAEFNLLNTSAFLTLRFTCRGEDGRLVLSYVGFDGDRDVRVANPALKNAIVNAVQNDVPALATDCADKTTSLLNEALAQLKLDLAVREARFAANDGFIFALCTRQMPADEGAAHRARGYKLAFTFNGMVRDVDVNVNVYSPWLTNFLSAMLREKTPHKINNIKVADLPFGNKVLTECDFPGCRVEVRDGGFVAIVDYVLYGMFNAKHRGHIEIRFAVSAHDGRLTIAENGISAHPQGAHFVIDVVIRDHVPPLVRNQLGGVIKQINDKLNEELGKALKVVERVRVNSINVGGEWSSLSLTVTR